MYTACMANECHKTLILESVHVLHTSGVRPRSSEMQVDILHYRALSHVHMAKFPASSVSVYIRSKHSFEVNPTK